MIDLASLPGHVNAVLTLTFADGHVVRAKLVSVDLELPHEIIYEVLEVIERGPARLAGVKPGTVASADPSLLASVQRD